MKQKKDISVQVVSTDFPNQFATSAEKDTDEYGLKVGNAILSEWFLRDGVRCRYYDQWADFHRLRKYARGEQSVSKYKNELAIDGDLSMLNLDFTPIHIIPKFVDIVVNGMQDRLFKVKAYAQDAMSQKKRSAYQDSLEAQMVSKELLEMIQQNTGANPFASNPDELPESDEQLALHMQLKYKPAIEIAEEEAISTLFDENKYQDTKKRVDQDIVEIGIGIAKHEFLLGAGVQISYVDPANVIYSYTEDPYFKDCFYWGEIKTLPIAEITKIKPDITQEELELISQYSSSWYNYYNLEQYYERDVFSRDTCTLLYFNYKTTKKVVYKKKLYDGGGMKVIRKDEDFNPPEEMMEEGRFEKMEKTIEVWYEGVMVAGAPILLKWGVMENMVRPKSSSQHAIPNYVACAPRMYKGRIDSLVRRMIPFADLIQITHLKLMQVIQRLVPDGVYIDADGINEVNLGNGQAYSPQDALKLYFQTGSVIGRSQTQDGEYNHAKIPIQELSKTSGRDKALMLIESYNHYLNSIRDVTGLNEARDGSMPDPNSLVGLQKLAALNSNTATRHILDAGLFITRSIAEALTYRVSDILQYADFKDDFANKIGRYNVGLLNEIKDLYIYDFGIFIDVAPDEEEKAQLEANIQVALSKGDINLEDAIDIREVKNIKLANQLLKLKRIRKKKEDQQFAREQQMLQSETQLQSQQLAAQAAQAKIAAEAESKIGIKQMESQADMEKMKLEAELKAQLMEQEFQYKMQLVQAQQSYLTERDTMRETEKNNREDKRSSAQSKLIDQRKNNLPPLNFESRQDSLDGFNLQEFDIR
jgi:hypothetical protein